MGKLLLILIFFTFAKDWSPKFREVSFSAYNCFCHVSIEAGRTVINLGLKRFWNVTDLKFYVLNWMDSRRRNKMQKLSLVQNIWFWQSWWVQRTRYYLPSVFGIKTIDVPKNCGANITQGLIPLRNKIYIPICQYYICSKYILEKYNLKSINHQYFYRTLSSSESILYDTNITYWYIKAVIFFY